MRSKQNLQIATVVSKGLVAQKNSMILMLTVHSSVEHVATVLAAGANGYASVTARNEVTWQSRGVGLAGARGEGSELDCFVGCASSQ